MFLLMTACVLTILLSTVMKMDKLKSDAVTPLTPEAFISSARQGKKHSSTTSHHCKTRRRSNPSHLLHSLASNNSAICKSDDDFGQFVARELKMIHNVRAKQFAKLQIHSILFNAQFDIMSTPPDVIHSMVHHQSFNSSLLSSALNSQYYDSNNT